MSDTHDLNIWYKNAFEYIQDIIWELDLNLAFTFVSPNSRMMTGYENTEMIGRCILDFLSPESKQNIINQWNATKQERFEGITKISMYDVEFICKDGRVIWYEVSVKPIIDEGKFTGYIGTSRDISEKKEHELEIKKYVQELEYSNKKLDELTTFDMLTGAYSRRKFEEFIAMPVEKREKEGIPFSLIMFDIDYFKQINDLYGHKTGDYILQEVSLNVRNNLRGSDKLFRWGGDEFVVLLQDTSLKDAYDLAEIIRMGIEVHKFGMENKDITISLGVGEFQAGENLDQFLSNVDKAMLKAKSDGRNRIETLMLPEMSFCEVCRKLAKKLSN
ncbi:MAG: sensor domain-containing diguanylate cyclase [Bacillota bacterium]